MSKDQERALREAAYFIWIRAGRPEGRAHEHWQDAVQEQASAPEPTFDFLDEEEKALDGRPDVDLPALLTKDVLGG
jgi:Protein of unknown function (DUF2934)